MLGDPIKVPGIEGSTGGTKTLLGSTRTATATGTSGTTSLAASGTTSGAPNGGSAEFEQLTRFHCPTTGFGGNVFGTQPMIEVLDANGGGISGVGPYMVAALLNARAGRTPVLSEGDVREMWNALINDGYYEPTAGFRWTATEIIAYLQTTMG